MINPPVGPLHIFSLGRYSPASSILPFLTSGGFNSTAVPAANRALYCPLQVPVRFTVARFFSSNGSGVNGTFDIGLFSQSGIKLISTGSTSQAGTTQAQYVDVTDQSFPPGFYYLGFVGSTVTTARYNAITFTDQYEARGAGMLQEALGSAVLPAAMTPASYASNAVYFFGFTQSGTL